jgi:hypothetical protein
MTPNTRQGLPLVAQRRSERRTPFWSVLSRKQTVPCATHRKPSASQPSVFRTLGCEERPPETDG